MRTEGLAGSFRISSRGSIRRWLRHNTIAKILITPAAIAWVLSARPTASTAGTAGPSPIERRQPDGSKITLRIHGDEWYHWAETTAGHTVVKDRDGWWVYADLGPAGEYVPTSYRVGASKPGTHTFLTRVGRHLVESAERRENPLRDVTDEERQQKLTQTRKRFAANQPVNFDFPVLLIEYPDEMGTYPLETFESLFFDTQDTDGTMKDYYLEISYGDLTIGGTVNGWYTSSNNSAYYVDDPDLPQADRFSKAAELVREAAVAADGAVDFSQFDNDGPDGVPNSGDDDGKVDAVLVVFAGNPAYDGGTVWPHQSTLSKYEQQVTLDGVMVEEYAIVPETKTRGTTADLTGIGTPAHEFGHVLGLPDLYDRDSGDQRSRGIGHWGLMGDGEWGADHANDTKPTHMCAWSKVQVGWITPTTVETNVSGQVILPVETNDEAFQVLISPDPLGPPPKEYFLLENRRQIGFDEDLSFGGSHTGGLLIWHIDEAQGEKQVIQRMVENEQGDLEPYNVLTAGPQNRDEKRRWVGLEQADGLGHLEFLPVPGGNFGDGGDPFPGSTGNTAFNDVSTPNSKDNHGVSTGVYVENISLVGLNVVADIGAGVNGTPDLWVRDCPTDAMGVEQCELTGTGNPIFWNSVDIYIDNDQDGVADAPIFESLNRLVVRTWNRGPRTANARVRCWFKDPGLGLTFGTGSLDEMPVVDALTGSQIIFIPTMGTLEPGDQPENHGYEAEFWWPLEAPPQGVNHYCVGCLIETDLDQQGDIHPLYEDNLAMINMHRLVAKAGTVPAGVSAPPLAERSSQTPAITTVFREALRLNNVLMVPTNYTVVVTGLESGYSVLPDDSVQVFLPDTTSYQSVVFDLINQDSNHGDSIRVHFEYWANSTLVGGLGRDIIIDDYPPEVVSCWDASYYETGGDVFRNDAETPLVELTWCAPTKDTVGSPEVIWYYEVHGSSDSTALLLPDSMHTMLDQTKSDDDLQKPGYQWHYFGHEGDLTYFTIIPVDRAGNKGAAAPIKRVQPPPVAPPAPKPHEAAFHVVPAGSTLVTFDFQDPGGNPDTEGWQSVDLSGRGDFASLYLGLLLLQEDDCFVDILQMWGFFDNPVVTSYACHSPNPEPGMGAIPFGNAQSFMHNEIWSPPIANTGSGTDYRLRFRVYRDLPLDNLVFYTWRVRSWTAGVPGPWRDRNLVYYGGQRDWLQVEHPIGDLIDPSADAIQVALGAKDMCAPWCNVLGGGACHSHAPLFDDVAVARIPSSGPRFGVRHIDLFQDNFSGDGTLTGTSRADAACDILPAEHPGMQAGDSVAVRISPLYAPENLPSAWIYVRVQNSNDPKSGALLGSADTRPGKSGPRWPHDGTWVDANGKSWDIFQMDDCVVEVGSFVLERVADCYCVDLNDDLFVPGDTILYFFAADADPVANNGNESYWHRTIDGQGVDHTTAEIEVAAASPCEFTILPAGGYNRGGDILYVDDADDRDGPPQLSFDDAFARIGMADLVDRYDVLGPSSAAGNSLASRVKTTLQLIGPYKKILWDSGELGSGTVGDGAGSPEKSDDFCLLYDFLDNDPDNPGLFIAGDDVAEEWASATGCAVSQLLPTYLNFTLLDGDHTAHDEPVSPLLKAVGAPFTHSSVADSLIAFGGCPNINDFDVLQPAGSTVIQFPYPMSGDGAVISQQTTNQAGQTATVVLSGFSFQHIYSATAGFPMARVEFMRDLLLFLDNSPGEPTGVDPGMGPLANYLDQNYPNPFNPSTTIQFGIKKQAHVSLRIYDVAGRLVKTLVNEVRKPGTEYSVKWHGDNDSGQQVATGVYFYRLMTENFTQTRKIVFLK